MSAAPAILEPVSAVARRMGMRRSDAASLCYELGLVREVCGRHLVSLAELEEALRSTPRVAAAPTAPRVRARSCTVREGTMAATKKGDGSGPSRPTTIYVEWEDLDVRIEPHRPPCKTSPHWSWRIRWTAGGREHCRSVGRQGVREVTRAALLILQEMNEPGHAPAAVYKPRQSTAPITVAELMRRWSADKSTRADLAEATKARVRYIAARWAQSTLARRRADLLTNQSLRAHYDAELRNGLSAGTVKNALIELRAALRWAAESGIGGVTVVPDPPRIDYTPERSATAPPDGIIRRIVAALTGWHRDVLIVIIETGARPSEICGLDASQIFLNEGTPYLKVLKVSRSGGRGKTGARSIHLDPRGKAVEILTRRLAESSSRDGRVWPRKASTTYDRLNKALIALPWDEWGVEKVVLRDLRAASVDRLARAGVDVSVAARRHGHSPATAMRYYRKVSERELEKAAMVRVDLDAADASAATARVDVESQTVPFKRGRR